MKAIRLCYMIVATILLLPLMPIIIALSFITTMWLVKDVKLSVKVVIENIKQGIKHNIDFIKNGL